MNYWVRTTFLLKKCMILMFLMNALPTDQPTDQPTNRPTDTAYYRDARTHLKRWCFMLPWQHENKNKIWRACIKS